MSTKTLIRGGHVISVDPTIGDLPAGDVLIEDDRIAAVGADLGDVDAHIIDAKGMIVMPGMIDTHRHTWQTQMRGICADWTITDYINGIRLAISPNYTPQDVYLGNYLGSLEALNAGVTTIIDFSHCNNSQEHSDGAVRGLLDSGIRALFSYGFFDSSPETSSFRTHAERLSDFRRIVKTFGEASPLITYGVALTEVGFIPWHETVAEIQAARDVGGRIIAHTGCLWGSMVNTGIVEMHMHGLLGADHVHVHCTDLGDVEWRMLAEADAKISIAVETELNMGMGFPAFAQCRKWNRRPTLSCDVISLNSGDLFHQMRMGIAAQRWADNDVLNRDGALPTELTYSARDAIDWVTVNGADAIGQEDRLGSLTPGKQADVIVIGNQSSIAWNPVIDAPGSVVFQATPADVRDVFVAGRAVKRDFSLVDVNTQALAEQARESADAILERVRRTHLEFPIRVEGRYNEIEAMARQNLSGAYTSEGSGR